MPNYPPQPTLVRYAITATSNWRCPLDVTSIMATGFGGGGSGGGGATTGGGGGGGGSVISSLDITVVPGTLYTITIGAGGTGVAAATAGNIGADTTMTGGALANISWSGASGGGIGAATAGGGQPFLTRIGNNDLTGTVVGMASQGAGGFQAAPATAGLRNIVGAFDGGAAGATVTVTGGGGGGAGPEGVGGAGATGSGTTGGTGTAAAANTGAGGGAGGGGTTAGGPSGAGGSGKLYLQYSTVYTTVVTS